MSKRKNSNKNKGNKFLLALLDKRVQGEWVEPNPDLPPGVEPGPVVELKNGRPLYGEQAKIRINEVMQGGKVSRVR